MISKQTPKHCEKLDVYFLSPEEKRKLEEEKVIEALKVYDGSVKIQFDRKEQDAKALFGIYYEQLMVIVTRLKRKGILDYRSDYDPYHVNYRRIFFAKRMRAALAAPVIEA